MCDGTSMLTHEKICSTIKKVAGEYSLTKVEYFGSYAEGRATEKSDLDLLVEFAAPNVSVIKQVGLKHRLEEMLDTPVDLVHAPVPEESMLEIGRTVVAYEQKR